MVGERAAHVVVALAAEHVVPLVRGRVRVRSRGRGRARGRVRVRVRVRVRPNPNPHLVVLVDVLEVRRVSERLEWPRGRAHAHGHARQAVHRRVQHVPHLGVAVGG